MGNSLHNLRCGGRVSGPWSESGPCDTIGQDERNIHNHIIHHTCGMPPKQLSRSSHHTLLMLPFTAKTTEKPQSQFLSLYLPHYLNRHRHADRHTQTHKSTCKAGGRRPRLPGMVITLPSVARRERRDSCARPLASLTLHFKRFQAVPRRKDFND